MGAVGSGWTASVGGYEELSFLGASFADVRVRQDGLSHTANQHTTKTPAERRQRVYIEDRGPCEDSQPRVDIDSKLRRERMKRRAS